MKKFIRKFALFATIFLLLLELFCRVFVDQYYFNKIDLYNSTEKDKIIFVGSSRVPATIDKKVFAKYNMNCVVAGRGYTTGGIHLTALQYKLKNDPEYLKNAKVFIEYPENVIFIQNAKRFQYHVFEPKSSEFDAPMPHVMLPYLDREGLKQFLLQSPNSLDVKLKMFFLYCFSSYRCVLLFQDKQPVKYVLERLFNGKRATTKSNLTSDGGIKSSNLKRAHFKAVVLAKNDSAWQARNELLRKDVLDESILAKLNTLITENGGRMYLYKVPLHTIQQNISKSKRATENKSIFLQWLAENGISIVEAKEFEYIDNDFPDTWHLSVERRQDFSTRLAREIIKENVNIPIGASLRQ